MEGMWYSESYMTLAPGCTGSSRKSVAMSVGAHTDSRILLAKFEVFNDPGCFDPAYEKAKQQAAKPCINGKCA
mgnify:FL=1